MPFADIENKRYRVNIYGYTDEVTPPATIQLQASDNPLTIDEDISDDFFAPIRSQTGNLGVCTKLPTGSMLNLDNLLPSTNLSTPVRVEEYVNGAWQIAWLGFLSCEEYNQAYTNIPENISLPLLSILEAWKSAYITINKVETVAELLNELINIQIGNYFMGVQVPQDYAIFTKYINTSIFIDKKEYQNEESTLYELQGSSAHDILSAICQFMGWTAREDKGVLYLEVMQGYGQISGTETRNMSSLVWWGTNHQRSIRQGKRIGSVNAKLAAFEIKTGLAGIPFGSFNYEKYQQIAPPLQTGTWVYFLPSSNIDAYSNMTIRFLAGSLKMGIQNDPNYLYDFQRLTDDVYVDEMIVQAIPYTDNYQPLREPTTYHTIYAGAVFARMQFDDANDPDIVHQNTKDGLLVSFFPGAWNGSVGSPIFEMRSVQNFAVMEDGYINISSTIKAFVAAPWVGVSQSTDRIIIDLQVGNKVWNGSAWVDANGNAGKLQMQLAQDGTKFQGNWTASMDIDETEGYLIPNWYTENGVKKRVMGRVILRIYPETYILNIPSAQRSNFICNIFFEELSFDYIMVRSVKLSDRSDNNYRRTINTEFKEDVEISTDLASWFNNNPSPSLLYNEDQLTPMNTLPYLTSDGETTKDQRPEMNLLDRMQAYYSKPRTILQLPVKHIEDKPLPLLRFNGLNDGKVYIPLAESRNYQTKESKITFIETPTETQESQ